MSCQGKSKITGLSVNFANGVVVAAHHGCADAAFDEAMQRFTFADTEAVIADLADKSLPMPVRAVMLRNLAMNKVSAGKLKGLLSKEEVQQYRRYQGVQKILAWGGLVAKN
jgi:hypothetical protein